ncbi:hypothetical protein [Mucilaginibacter terrenus]|uniref:hypothetical protein n=1 Tax=Mucilaginibacter terrenus TaxID=2482727 RepID=UPI0014036BC9|nr:hypothetical protein [Mucilaginibacter terrenus]
MNDNTNSAKDLEVKIKARVDKVNPHPDNHQPKVSAQQHSSGPVEFPDDLARFMAYAG